MFRCCSPSSAVEQRYPHEPALLPARYIPLCVPCSSRFTWYMATSAHLCHLPTFSVVSCEVLFSIHLASPLRARTKRNSTALTGSYSILRCPHYVLFGGTHTTALLHFRTRLLYIYPTFCFLSLLSRHSFSMSS